MIHAYGLQSVSDSQLKGRVPQGAGHEATGSAFYNVDFTFHNKGILGNHSYCSNKY